MQFLAVAVAAIHHQAVAEPLPRQAFGGILHVALVIIGAGAATQYDVACGIAFALDHHNAALAARRCEQMGGFTGLNGIDGDPDIAVCAVLEADRTGQRRGQLTVHLGFGGAGADGSPADEVGKIEEAGGIENSVAVANPRRLMSSSS